MSTNRLPRDEMSDYVLPNTSSKLHFTISVLRQSMSSSDIISKGKENSLKLSDYAAPPTLTQRASIVVWLARPMAWPRGTSLFSRAYDWRMRAWHAGARGDWHREATFMYCTKPLDQFRLRFCSSDRTCLYREQSSSLILSFGSFSKLFSLSCAPTNAAVESEKQRPYLLFVKQRRKGNRHNNVCNLLAI